MAKQMPAQTPSRPRHQTKTMSTRLSEIRSSTLVPTLNAPSTRRWPRHMRKMRPFYRSFPIRDTPCHELSWSRHLRLMETSTPTP